jgi:hypothetical protein
LIFLVTIPFHEGSDESSEKDVFGSEKSSERSSETTAISSGTGSGTHPHKVLGQAKRQRRARGHPYIKQKHTRIQFKFDFCEKTTKIALKNGLSIDWGIILFVISGFYTIFVAKLFTSVIPCQLLCQLKNSFYYLFCFV